MGKERIEARFNKAETLRQAENSEKIDDAGLRATGICQRLQRIAGIDTGTAEAR